MAINRREVVTFSVFVFVCSVRGTGYTKQKVVEQVGSEAERKRKLGWWM